VVLTNDQGGKSIALQMENERPAGDPRPKLAHDWAALRSATNINGYPTFEEALAALEEILG